MGVPDVVTESDVPLPTWELCGAEESPRVAIDGQALQSAEIVHLIGEIVYIIGDLAVNTQRSGRDAPCKYCQCLQVCSIGL